MFKTWLRVRQPWIGLYGRYLTGKIQDGEAHNITCPGFECTKLVPVEVIETVVSRDVARRYLQFDIKVSIMWLFGMHCLSEGRAFIWLALNTYHVEVTFEVQEPFLCHDFLYVLVFDPCYARATVMRARFLAAAFSDGSYLAHVNSAYLCHIKFSIVRGPRLFIVSPISRRGPLPRLVQSPWRRTPASPILV